jgi:hypothetical protein
VTRCLIMLLKQFIQDYFTGSSRQAESLRSDPDDVRDLYQALIPPMPEPFSLLYQLKPPIIFNDFPTRAETR